MTQGEPSPPPHATPAHDDEIFIAGAWLIFVHGLWATLVTLVLGFFVTTAPARYDHLRQVAAANRDGLAQLGLSAEFLATYIFTLDVVAMAIFTLIALILYVRKSDERLARFVSATLLLIGVTLTRPGDSLSAINPELHLHAIFLLGVGTAAVALFLHVFPDGHFVPRWSRWLAYVWITACLAWYFLPPLLTRPAPWPPREQPGWLALGWLGSGLFVQIYRYVRVSGPAERQQTKWVVYGLAAAGVGFIGFLYLAPTALTSVREPGLARALYVLLGVPFLYASLLCLPFSIAVSILRYRLWDVDVIFNRTLVYGALTVILAAVYGVSIVVLQSFFNTVAGEGDELVIVLSTLFIAALFQPLRRHVQTGIDRRFYRHKYNAEKALAAFGAAVRNEAYVDLEYLTERIRTVLDETVAPEHMAVCFHASTGFHLADGSVDVIVAADDPLCDYLLEVGDAVDVERIPVESPAVQQLRDTGTALVVPVISQSTLIGIFALGPRRSGQDYSADDRALLSLLAGHAGPAIRVAQLVAELEAEAQTLARMEQELQVARLIQQTLLPKDVPPLPGWEMATYYRPARAVGGDFYDFIQLPNGRLGLVIGDVTDTGVPAALVMATTRGILRVESQEHFSPGQVLERANDLLHLDMPHNMFVTCLYAILDPETGHLRYANAGHNLPYRWRNGDVVELRATGVPMGLMPDMNYDARETVLTPGETLVFYSDGLVEAHNEDREMFGGQRLSAIIRRQPHDDAAGEVLIEVLLSELNRFLSENGEQEDDVTLVTVQRTADDRSGIA